MSVMRWAGVFMLGLVCLAGCKTKTDEPQAPAPAPVPVVEDDVKARLQRLEPNALIGRVTAILAEDRLAAVGEVPPQDFSVGDVVVFYGASEQVVGHGKVVKADATLLHVKFEEPAAGQRAPAVGDLVIRFKR